jgi:hypothetical protein
MRPCQILFPVVQDHTQGLAEIVTSFLKADTFNSTRTNLFNLEEGINTSLFSHNSSDVMLKKCIFFV